MLLRGWYRSAMTEEELEAIIAPIVARKRAAKIDSPVWAFCCRRRPGCGIRTSLRAGSSKASIPIGALTVRRPDQSHRALPTDPAVPTSPHRPSVAPTRSRPARRPGFLLLMIPPQHDLGARHAGQAMRALYGFVDETDQRFSPKNWKPKILPGRVAPVCVGFRRVPGGGAANPERVPVPVAAPLLFTYLKMGSRGRCASLLGRGEHGGTEPVAGPRGRGLASVRCEAPPANSS